MFCEKCGKKIPDDAAYCTHCGAKQVTASPAVQPVASVPPPQPARPSVPQQQPQTSGGVDLISMGQYLIMFLIMAIPIANIVMLFVWGFSSETGPNKKNFARATLIMMAIGIGVGILISIVMAAIMASIISTMYYY